MVNKYRAEVDASEFGPGFTIRLDMDGHAKIESIGGNEPAEIGRAILIMQQGLALASAHHVREFLGVSLRGTDGKVVPELPEFPDVPLGDIAAKCLDTMALFRYGKDHETWKAENEAKARASQDKAPTANPTKGTRA
jgi:hypothetical protein